MGLLTDESRIGSFVECKLNPSGVLSPISCVPLKKKVQLRSEPADLCCGRHKGQALLSLTLQSQALHVKAVRAFYSSSEQITLYLVTQKVMSV